MIDEAKNPWQTLSELVVYESPWLKVFHHEVINPSGNRGVYGFVHFKKFAIGIIPLDGEHHTWLVGQYRYPSKQYTWEIPEGGGDMRLDPLESAQRELLEECGIVARKWDLICDMQVSNSATDEIAYIFAARDLSFRTPQPDDTEKLEVKRIPFEQAFEMVMQGQITDSISVAGIMKIKLLMERDELSAS